MIWRGLVKSGWIDFFGWLTLCMVMVFICWCIRDGVTNLTEIHRTFLNVDGVVGSKIRAFIHESIKEAIRDSEAKFDQQLAVIRTKTYLSEYRINALEKK